jgi:hypothetical protein
MTYCVAFGRALRQSCSVSREAARDVKALVQVHDKDPNGISESSCPRALEREQTLVRCTVVIDCF